LKQTGNIRLIGIVVIIGIFVFAVMNPGTHQFSAASNPGYVNAADNPTITFYGEEYNGKYYVQNPSTSLTFSGGVNSAGTGNPTKIFSSINLPTVDGEMTPVFIPSNSAEYISVFPGITLPSSWSQGTDMYYAPNWQENPTAELQNPPQPVETYNWNVTSSAGTPYMVQMQQWDQKFYVSFSTSWSGNNQNPASYLDPLHTHLGNYYNNLWIWFKVSTPVMWYIQGGGVAYQAIDQINLDANTVMEAKTNSGSVATDNTEAVNPESAPSVVYLDYNPFGNGNQLSTPTYETYDGLLLNPAYFVNTTYFGINLATFGNYADGLGGILGSTTKGDVATFDFDVTTFVFGQYTVLDVMNNPSQYGRTTPETTVTSVISNLLGWLANPVNIGLLLTIGLIILVIIFAPWLLLVLVALVFGGRKR
jgi:hypothetical protein